MKNTNIIDSIIDNSLRFLFDFLAQQAFNSINKDTQNPNLVQKKVLKKILKLQKNYIMLPYSYSVHISKTPCYSMRMQDIHYVHI